MSIDQEQVSDLADRITDHLNGQMGPFTIRVAESFVRDALLRENGDADVAWDTIMGAWEDYAGSVNLV